MSRVDVTLSSRLGCKTHECDRNAGLIDANGGEKSSLAVARENPRESGRIDWRREWDSNFPSPMESVTYRFQKPTVAVDASDAVAHYTPLHAGSARCRPGLPRAGRGFVARVFLLQFHQREAACVDRRRAVPCQEALDDHFGAMPRNPLPHRLAGRRRADLVGPSRRRAS